MATTAPAAQQPIVNAKTGKLKRILIIAAIATILLGAGAGVAYFLLHKDSILGPAKAAPALPRVLPARLHDRQPSNRRRHALPARGPDAQAAR